MLRRLNKNCVDEDVYVTLMQQRYYYVVEQKQDMKIVVRAQSNNNSNFDSDYRCRGWLFI